NNCRQLERVAPPTTKNFPPPLKLHLSSIIQSTRIENTTIVVLRRPWYHPSFAPSKKLFKMKNLLPLQRLCSSAAILFSFIMLTLPFGKVSGQCTPLGDTSVYGNHVWNVYAFNAGDESDNGQSWRNNYSGYYVDSTLNFNTQTKWPDW